MLVSSVEFTENYTTIVRVIESVICPALFPEIRRLYETDPHDLIRPDSCFASSNEAIGFVFQYMIKMYKDRTNAT